MCVCVCDYQIYEINNKNVSSQQRKNSSPCLKYFFFSLTICFCYSNRSSLLVTRPTFGKVESEVWVKVWYCLKVQHRGFLEVISLSVRICTNLHAFLFCFFCFCFFFLSGPTGNEGLMVNLPVGYFCFIF